MQSLHARAVHWNDEPDVRAVPAVLVDGIYGGQLPDVVGSEPQDVCADEANRLQQRRRVPPSAFSAIATAALATATLATTVARHSSSDPMPCARRRRTSSLS